MYTCVLISVPLPLPAVTMQTDGGVPDCGWTGGPELHPALQCPPVAQLPEKPLPSLDDDYPLECDCLASFPVAMYCHSRNIQHIYNIQYVPSHMKYVYLQCN